MSKTTSTTLAALAVFLLLAAAPSTATAQEAEKAMPGHQHGMMHGETMHHGDDAPPDCRAMMEKAKAMQAEQQKMDARLDALVERMNGSTGEAQQKAMAELLTAMVEQREKIHHSMMSMQPMMMEHMMMHSHAGGEMHECPMMEKMHSGEASAVDCPMADAARTASADTKVMGCAHSTHD